MHHSRFAGATALIPPRFWAPLSQQVGDILNGTPSCALWEACRDLLQVDQQHPEPSLSRTFATARTARSHAHTDPYVQQGIRKDVWRRSLIQDL